jgi:hypothetical protein
MQDQLLKNHPILCLSNGVDSATLGGNSRPYLRPRVDATLSDRFLGWGNT